MAKFVIECPNCGKYAEAKTGFLARKKIDCSCGYMISVCTDKLASKVCPHCGNHVVYDQGKGESALCPVCHSKINILAEKQKIEEFSCAQCGVRLSSAQSAATYMCPVCDHINNVQERLTRERIKKDELASVIKYEGDNETIVWKHPIEDFNFGSQLIVHESQEAVFFKDGQALDLFGAGRYTLETQQLPILKRFFELPTGLEGTFHSEVYYINMATQMGIKWGTDSKVRVFDPVSGLHVELGASGEFNIQVINSRKLLLKVIGITGSLVQEQLLGEGSKKGYFRSMIMTQVKSYLAQAIKENRISILEIDSELMKLSNALRDQINKNLEAYGLFMTEFFVGCIKTPDDDPNFRKMKEQYAEQYLLVKQEQIRRSEADAAAERKAVEAQTAARMKIISAQGDAEALKIQKAAEVDAYKMQIEAEAAEMRMKGYTYQQETSRMVGMEAMQNGLTGGPENSGVSVLGDLAGLGIGLGAMGGMMNMTKDAIAPLMEAPFQIGQEFGNTVQNTWDCTCGNKAIAGNFCSACGSKRAIIKPVTTWDCACGNKDLTGAFCSNCGLRRQDFESTTWDCTCGERGITGNYCNNCGKKRGGDLNEEK